MIFELSQRFFFDAAHTLHREIDRQGSRRIHGHTYHAQIFVRGKPDPETGMIVDLGLLNRAIEQVRDQLDHHFLDDIPELGPATLESLCIFILKNIRNSFPEVSRVRVERAAGGNACDLYVEEPR
ncbi:6-carboxytetrahydropterin synthase [Burkholderia vietnamiensis]|uniref:6-carboxy-5,6,7,8-tetrahydropterin synthase n=1 Tax=Burkholderia vietnamiensis TaxID=60552 RepID=A0AA44Y5D6_BURVI|nr:6-carboxytetrahydropterin synthase [Burkholderia vietnamiensis]PRH42940.1 6-carboxytetrahydropterin synthase [Burkholderia vietnamiensis]